jgi:hypothetical protein
MIVADEIGRTRLISADAGWPATMERRGHKDSTLQKEVGYARA